MCLGPSPPHIVSPWTPSPRCPHPGQPGDYGQGSWNPDYAAQAPTALTPPSSQGLFMVMFSIISMDFFQLEPAQTGYLNSYFGILMMVSGHQVPRAGPGSRAHPSFSAALGCAAPLSTPTPPPPPRAEHHDPHSLPLLRPPLRLCTQTSVPTACRGPCERGAGTRPGGDGRPLASRLPPSLPAPKPQGALLPAQGARTLPVCPVEAPRPGLGVAFRLGLPAVSCPWRPWVSLLWALPSTPMERGRGQEGERGVGTCPLTSSSLAGRTLGRQGGCSWEWRAVGDSGWRGLAAVQAPSYPPRPLSQVIQGLLIGRLSRHFSEEALLWASVLVFSLVGLAMVRALPPQMPPAKSRGLGPLPHRPHLHWSPWAPPHQGRLCGASATGPGLGPPVWGPRPWPLGDPRHHGPVLPGADVQRPPLLPPGAWPGLQPVCSQRGHRQHADQGRLGLRHG